MDPGHDLSLYLGRPAPSQECFGALGWPGREHHGPGLGVNERGRRDPDLVLVRRGRLHARMGRPLRIRGLAERHLRAVIRQCPIWSADERAHAEDPLGASRRYNRVVRRHFRVPGARGV